MAHTTGSQGHLPYTLTASAGEGRFRVEGILVATGSGIIMTLAGGERPHVGAVGLGVPRPSLRDPERTSATSSVLAVTGHRDDELAKPLAEQAASRLKQIAVVVVGVHVDGASPEEIAFLAGNVRQAAERLLAGLGPPQARQGAAQE